MKIGIMGTRGIPNNYGGFEQFAQQLSLGLQQKGHEVWVYNSIHHPFGDKEWNGVHIIHCNDWENRIGTAGQFIYDLNCINDARERNFDVLFHFGYTSDSLWWRRWPKNTKNIVNMDGLEWKRRKYNRLTSGFLKKAEALAVAHASIMIADSPAIQEYIYGKYKKKPVFIPYGAEVFTRDDAARLDNLKLRVGDYLLLIARMEPENNIELIIRGYIASQRSHSLVVVGSMDNKFGKYLLKKYSGQNILFAGSIFDQALLNNLRFFSRLYFHGHSVGGTNPSLLEAMACGCAIAAHDNVFNKAVLGNEATYFSTAEAVTAIISDNRDQRSIEQDKMMNYEKIRSIYDPAKIIDAYESLALNACRLSISPVNFLLRSR